MLLSYNSKANFLTILILINSFSVLFLIPHETMNIYIYRLNIENFNMFKAPHIFDKQIGNLNIFFKHFKSIML